MQNLRIGGGASKSQYQFVVQGLDQDRARPLGGPAADAMGRDAATFTDVTTDLQNTALQATVTIDRDKARALGITADQLRSTLYTGFGTQQVSTIYETGDSYEVIVEFDPALELDRGPARPRAYPRRQRQAHPAVRLRIVERTAGPLSVNQLGQLPAVTISFNLPAGVSLGDAVQRIDAIKAQELGVPTTISTSFAGTAQVFQEALANQGLLLAAAVIDDLHRARHPLRELHPPADHPDRPAGGGGRRARRARAVRARSLVIAIIGILMLIGIVKKNAIMMIDFALVRQREEGASAFEAIREACLLRFRPIMMTTLAAHHGHAADRARRRRELGAAPAARHRGRRRPRRVAAADAVHHAGALPLHGPPADRAEVALPAQAPGPRGGPRTAGHDACRVTLKADIASRRESAFGTAAPCAVLSKMHHTGAPLFA